MAPEPKLMVKTAALSFGLTERKVVRSYKKKKHPKPRTTESVTNIWNVVLEKTLETKAVKQIHSLFFSPKKLLP